MKPGIYRTLAIALPAALLGMPAHAQIPLGSIGGSTLSADVLLQGDANWFRNDVVDLDGDANADRDMASDLRRAEFSLTGKGPGRVDWVLAYDAKAAKWLDANLRYRFGAGDAQSLQLGQFKQPSGLEELSSTRGNDFIAKSAPTRTFAVSRRLGAGYAWSGSDWGAAAALFGRELTQGLARGSGYGARAYWTPRHGAGEVLHLGASWVDYDTDADTLRLRARPDADLATARLLDTGALTSSDRIGILGLEALWLRGPLKLQGESFHARVDRDAAPGGVGTNVRPRDFDASGAYASAVWNLSGQHWDYAAGIPVVPKAGRSAGLWQLALRYDSLDLDDAGVAGGRMHTWTAGVNWYARSTVKLMLDYVQVRSLRMGVRDDPSIVEARVQLAF